MNIYVKLVEACNLHCAHCYNGEPNLDHLDTTYLKERLVRLFSTKGDKENWVILHGGEPLLANDEQIKDIMNMYPRIKMRITTNLTLPITTNRYCILLYMSDVRTSFDVGVHRFGSIQNLLRWYRNVKNLQKDPGIHLSTVNFCLTKQLLSHDPEQILRFAAHLGFHQISFEALCPTGRLKETDEQIPLYSDIDKWFCKMYNSLKGLNYNIKVLNFDNIFFGLVEDWDNYRGASCCANTLTINADGTVGECPNSARTHVLGTIEDKPEALLQHKCQGCNNKHLKECLACSYFSRCHGGCEEQAWHHGECPYPKLLSDYIKEDILEHSSIVPM